MLKSMTGFGRYELSNKDLKIIVEIKSVNHRYSDITIKMPKKLSFFESGIRNIIKKYAQRGKIDIFITYEDYTDNTVSIRYNEEIAQEYLNHLRSMSEKLGIENNVTVSSLSKFPEIFTLEEQSIDEKKLWEYFEEAIEKACQSFVETRIKEGESLKNDLMMKLDLILSYLDFIEERSPELVTEYRKKIETKVKELLGDAKIDDAILSTELILYADKTCIDEEIVRLKSHINNTKMTLEEGIGIGRKLDFIAQEMNREANTILSKANDLEISNKAIDLKTEIEKIREQIQNIE